MRKDKLDALVVGQQVQQDNSGVGHNWRNIDAHDIPADHRVEIEGEIIDGKRNEGEIFCGGIHYRWRHPGK